MTCHRSLRETENKWEDFKKGPKEPKVTRSTFHYEPLNFVGSTQGDITISRIILGRATSHITTVL